MLILKPSLFTGFYELVQGPADNTIIQSYIDLHEKKAIYNLLGITLGNLYIDDLVLGVPQSARFIAIHDTLTIEAYYHNILTSQGIPNILKGVVYYEYISNEQVKHSQSGAQKSEAENSKVLSVSDATSMAERRFNDVIESVQSIHKYISDNKATYPEYDLPLWSYNYCLGNYWNAKLHWLL